MQTKHWVIISGCLASIGTMVAAFNDWREALSPAFVGGVIGVIGAQIAALFSDKVAR